MSRTAMVAGGKHAVLVEALGYWYCIECASNRCNALGIKMTYDEE